MPVSRRGTRVTSKSMPVPARAAISQVEQVSPAAPMSWMPTRASLFITSRQASRRSFSMNGSPTWTAGRFSAEASSNSADAIVAALVDVVDAGDAEAQRVDERVLGVGFVEEPFAADGRDADGVAVAADP